VVHCGDGLSAARRRGGPETDVGPSGPVGMRWCACVPWLAPARDDDFLLYRYHMSVGAAASSCQRWTTGLDLVSAVLLGMCNFMHRL
jgi:hypothetical protein